jgi:XrtJ-associated TM-motif-TM protein
MPLRLEPLLLLVNANLCTLDYRPGDMIVSKLSLLAFCLAFFLCASISLHAQTGCEDSPENPTIVLALVGSAGALFSTVRSRLKTRRKSSSQ